jgi:hypothetical protein
MARRLIAVAALGMMLGACSNPGAGRTEGSAKATAPSSTARTTVSIKAAAAVYAARAARADAVSGAFASEAAGWPLNETGAQAESSASSVIIALQAFVRRMTDTKWPANVTNDVQTLVAAIAPVLVDLRSLGDLADLNDLSPWLQQFADDLTKVGTDAYLVRHDIGLPPVSLPRGVPEADGRLDVAL